MRILTLLLLFVPAIRAAVLAIDYGAEFTKLSLVKPGVPFDVVLDKDSKRKIQSVVGWKRDDRVFGQEGKMAATRFPDAHFPYVKPLLGSSAAPLLPIYPNAPTITADGALIFPHPSPPSHLSPPPTSSQEVWTPTAILAHQISYFRSLAESLHAPGTAPEPVNQVIVTVPAWWNQYQRKAYRDALELQGMTCLAMIGEGTGVALNYAMTRTFPNYDPLTGEGEKEFHVVYDSGAMSTTATVVAFYQTSKLPTPKAKTLINTTHIEILGTGWEEIGGVMLDVTLQSILASDFIEKSGKVDARDDKRGMAKIAREANRVKHILSANQESNVAIESLYNDIDYRSRVSRSDLEAALAPTQHLFGTPITSALEAAHIPLSNITSLILFGGNTRVPLVQSIIREVLGGDERIAQNVNADEGAVLGAAYYGAALSRQFKMKSLDLIERSVGVITLHGDVVFGQGSRMGEKKTLTFPVDDDSTLEFAQDGRPILSVHLVDVAGALSNFSSPSPIVNLTMRLDARGHLATANAVLVSNVTVAKEGGVAGALKGLFGGKKDKAEALESEVEGEETDEVVEVKGEKVALRFKETHLGVKPMTGEERRTTKARLASIAAFEAAKFSREEARNLLEGYLYRLSRLLESDAENKALQEFATDKERSTLKALVTKTFEWLSEHAEGAEEKLLRQKRADLEKLEHPIVFRFSEYHSRGKAVDDFQTVMFSSRSFLVEATKNNTQALEAAASATPEKPVAPPKYTEDELKGIKELLKDNEVWMDGLMEVQVKIEEEKTTDPVITSKELNERGKKLQMSVLKLINKKAPRAPRPSTTKTAASVTVDEEETALPTEPVSTDTDAETETTTIPLTSTTSAAVADESTGVPVHEEL